MSKKRIRYCTLCGGTIVGDIYAQDEDGAVYHTACAKEQASLEVNEIDNLQLAEDELRKDFESTQDTAVD